MSKYMRVEIQRLIPQHTSVIVKVNDEDEINLLKEKIFDQANCDDNWEYSDIHEDEIEISCIDEIEDFEVEPYDGEIVELTGEN